MRTVICTLICVAGFGAASTQAQHVPPYYSLGGFGSVLYPGTGHPPGTTPPASQFGARVYGGRTGGAFRADHGNHANTVIVPYPVFYGAYPAYGYDAPPAPAPEAVVPPAPAPPSVVINQNFAPERVAPAVQAPGDEQSSGMRLYQSPPTHPYADTQPAASQEEQPTIYLIAFRDHTIVEALGYWMEGNTLHYVSAEHTLNQASIDLIDRALSQRLNDERGVEFKLPAH